MSRALLLWSHKFLSTYNIKTLRSDTQHSIVSDKFRMIWPRISRMSTVLLFFQRLLTPLMTLSQECQLIAALLSPTLWMVRPRNWLSLTWAPFHQFSQTWWKQESQSRKRTQSLLSHLPPWLSRKNSMITSERPLTCFLDALTKTEGQSTNNSELRQSRLWHSFAREFLPRSS